MMLHIVNGDSVEDKLRQGAVQGEILVWREIYSEGPAFPEPAAPASRSVRADVLEKTLGIQGAEYIRSCERQEQQLNRFRDYDEIVLWFEYDLFDQTILWFLLHWFSLHSLGGTRLHVLSIDSFPGIEPFRGLGQLTAEQLAALAGTWQPVSQAALETGRACWEAYTSSDPRAMVQLLQKDLSALPFARGALRFHLSRFPSMRDGLGIVERTAIELVHQGAPRLSDLFRLAGGRLFWFGMGDIQFWAVLNRLASEPDPLISMDRLARSAAERPGVLPNFQTIQVRLTGTGLHVLEGKADRIALNGIDCWLGGVHLKGKEHIWRFDERNETLTRK